MRSSNRTCLSCCSTVCDQLDPLLSYTLPESSFDILTLFSVISAGVNPYDIRTNCSGSSDFECDPQNSLVTQYFNRSDVMSILGARTPSYSWHSPAVNKDFAMTGDFQRNFADLFPRILEEIPVLIYAISVENSPFTPNSHSLASTNTDSGRC